VKVWIAGKHNGQEERIAQDYGIAFKAVSVVKRPARKLSLETVSFVLNLARAVVSGWKVLGELRPVAVVGFGGFVSFPTVFAARLRGIPVYLHEQNSLMGTVNRLMARFSKSVLLSFENTEGAPAGKSLFTGNPSRYEGRELPDMETSRSRLGLYPGRKTLFVTGGSQGARSLNNSVCGWVSKNRHREDLQLIHLTGRKNFDEVQQAYKEVLGDDAAIRVDVKDYLKEMELAYKAADLVLCRAGASTITELTSLGVPAVFVPYPFATGNHQEINARGVVDAGAALMIRDSDLSAEKLALIIDDLIMDPEALSAMSEKSRKLYRDGVAERMANELKVHFQ